VWSPAPADALRMLSSLDSVAEGITSVPTSTATGSWDATRSGCGSLSSHGQGGPRYCGIGGRCIVGLMAGGGGSTGASHGARSAGITTRGIIVTVGSSGILGTTTLYFGFLPVPVRVLHDGAGGSDGFREVAVGGSFQAVVPQRAQHRGGRYWLYGNHS